MLEAMYGLEFVSNVNDDKMISSGCGVVILETGRILGGDSSFIYIGSYEFKSSMLEAKVYCKNDHEILPSIFGDIKEFNLILKGEPEHAEFILQGYMVENHKMKIRIKLTRRAELP